MQNLRGPETETTTVQESYRPVRGVYQPSGNRPNFSPPKESAGAPQGPAPQASDGGGDSGTNKE